MLQPPLPAHSDIPAAPSAGLRERRRRATAAEIHHAALACVERDGLEGSTVAKIAEAAGISSRTFFRYYPSKEAAILPGQGELGRALEELAERAPLEDLNPEEALGTLLGTLQELIAEDEIDHQEHRRIGMLIESEPALRAHIASEDAELIRRAGAVLRRLAPGYQADDARFHAELVFTAQRIAWSTWDKQGPSEEFPTPLARWRWALGRLEPSAALIASSTPKNG